MEKALEELKKLKARRVFLQFPEGLTLKIQDIVKELETNGFEVVICLERCYGACDIRDHEAKGLGCDAILHIGHEDFGCKSILPVVFWEYFIDVDPVPILQKEIKKLENYKRIGLVTSIQFVHTAKIVKDFLEMFGKNVYTHQALQWPGQVLGCRLDAAHAIADKIECFLCISAGKFYGLGVVLETDKPVFCMDLERKEIYSLDDLKKKIQKIIVWNKSQLQDAENIGLLISWKKGQFKQQVFEMKDRFEKEGKHAIIVAMDDITPDKIVGLKLDALINFACPRIGIDDLEKYKIPIVNWDQLDR
jgi:2-(3-amino-3-carboxypropyl)histidine synthase